MQYFEVVKHREQGQVIVKEEIQRRARQAKEDVSYSKNKEIRLRWIFLTTILQDAKQRRQRHQHELEEATANEKHMDELRKRQEKKVEAALRRNTENEQRVLKENKERQVRLLRENTEREERVLRENKESEARMLKENKEREERVVKENKESLTLLFEENSAELAALALMQEKMVKMARKRKSDGSAAPECPVYFSSFLGPNINVLSFPVTSLHFFCRRSVSLR